MFRAEGIVSDDDYTPRQDPRVAFISDALPR